jgi:hypothetical protein
MGFTALTRFSAWPADSLKKKKRHAVLDFRFSFADFSFTETSIARDGSRIGKNEPYK